MYGGGGYGSSNVDSPFIRQAEVRHYCVSCLLCSVGDIVSFFGQASTRTAFQSVESVVGAVSSVRLGHLELCAQYYLENSRSRY